MKGEESPPRQRPLVSIRLGSWSLLEEPHGGEAGSQSLLEETPQQGGGGRLGGGSDLNKAWKQSPLQSRPLYLGSGVKGGNKRAMRGMRVSCGWESVQGASRWLQGKGCWVVCRCQQPGPGEEDIGGEGPLFLREVLRLPTPSWLGSELPMRPLTPGLHNFQGTSQISGSSGRHPQTSHHHTAA